MLNVCSGVIKNHNGSVLLIMSLISLKTIDPALWLSGTSFPEDGVEEDNTKGDEGEKRESYLRVKRVPLEVGKFPCR